MKAESQGHQDGELTITITGGLPPLPGTNISMPELNSPLRQQGYEALQNDSLPDDPHHTPAHTIDAIAGDPSPNQGPELTAAYAAVEPETTGANTPVEPEQVTTDNKLSVEPDPEPTDAPIKSFDIGGTDTIDPGPVSSTCAFVQVELETTAANAAVEPGQVTTDPNGSVKSEPTPTDANAPVEPETTAGNPAVEPDPGPPPAPIESFMHDLHDGPPVNEYLCSRPDLVPRDVTNDDAH